MSSPTLQNSTHHTHGTYYLKIHLRRNFHLTTRSDLYRIFFLKHTLPQTLWNHFPKSLFQNHVKDRRPTDRQKLILRGLQSNRHHLPYRSSIHPSTHLRSLESFDLYHTSYRSKTGPCTLNLLAT
jgi:hypothetical protein